MDKCTFTYPGRMGGETCQHSQWQEAKEGLCIFHESNSEKDKALFQSKFERLLILPTDNFRCFIFPEDCANFSEYTFGKADFSGSEFVGEANFEKAIFTNKAGFKWAKFKSKARFRKAEFTDRQSEVNFEIATFNGSTDFDEAVFKCEAKFTGADFKDKAIFSKTIFQNSSYFDQVNFENDVIFQAEFQSSADFNHATFHKLADFSQAIFSNKELTAYFGFARFKEKAKFQRAVFKSQANFDSVEFERQADFLQAKFANTDLPSYFGSTVFTGMANFSNSVFLGNADFENAKFKGETNKSETAYLVGANFTFAQFHGEADFSVAEFSNPERIADFNGAKFEGRALFREAKFHGETIFLSAEFHDEAYFGRAEFFKCADFTNSKYLNPDKTADFSKTIFQSSAHFMLTNFHGNIAFIQAIIKGQASFRSAEFHKKAFFFETRFQGEADFGHCRFYGETSFCGERLDNLLFAEQESTHFNSVRFENPEKTDFSHVYLKRAYFSESDIEHIRFTDVDWPKSKEGHYFIFDDVNQRTNKTSHREYLEPPNEELLAKLYRHLSNNYKNSRDYRKSDDFFAGALESERRTAWKEQNYFRWITASLYKLFSSYGNNYGKAFFWLLFLGIAVPAGVYVKAVLPFIPPSKLALAALCQSLTVATFQRSRYFDIFDHSNYIHHWADAVAAGQSVVVAALLALFLLALRRRFRL